VIGQEEAIRTAISFLANPKVFMLFADAYNQNIKDYIVEQSKQGKQVKGLGEVYINAFRSIFMEGSPGTGKSTATLKTIFDILKKYHPDVLKKVVIVSNSKENAKRLT